MANVLNTDKQIAIIGSLCEGSSIRSIERITGVHRDTIMRLGVRVGVACADLQDRKFRNLDCRTIEIDEIWGFIGKKRKNLRPFEQIDSGFGDVWTYIALDCESKLIPAFYISNVRSVTATYLFIDDLSSRLRNRVQLSSDALQTYPSAIKASFGRDIDYAQV